MMNDPYLFHEINALFGPSDKLNHCEESLALTLNLSINGQRYTIPGANIKTCRISALRYGFSASLGF